MATGFNLPACAPWFSPSKSRHHSYRRAAVPSRRRQPSFDLLEGRLVLSTSSAIAATINCVDLTTPGSSGTINGAVFLQDSAHPAGVGVFQPFLRLQGKGTEEGLNTDAAQLPYNDMSSANWTHSVPLSSIGLVNYQGVDYRAFGLDINQVNAGGNAILNLTELRIYTASQSNLSNMDQFGTPLYDLNAGGASNSVILNGALNPGLGHSNMVALIPNANFANSAGSYLYLYCKFTNSNGGFEQWNFAAGTTPSTPPPPASLSGYVTGLQGIPLANVTVELIGTDVNGVAVDVSAVTDANGFYTFNGLEAGTYTLEEPQPSGVTLNQTSVGTVGGVTDGVALTTGDIAQITLEDGDQGIDYDFGETGIAG